MLRLVINGEMVTTLLLLVTAAFLLVHGPVVPGGGRLGSGAAPGGQGRAEGGVTGSEESRTGVQSKHRGGEVSGEAERSVSQPPPAPRCRQQPATALLRCGAALWTHRPEISHSS